MHEIQVLECPRCGAPVEAGGRVCRYCGSPYLVRSPENLSGIGREGIQNYLCAYQKLAHGGGGDAALYSAMGLCHLERGSYPQALKAFQKAVELLPENGDPYYFSALARFKGKRPFQALLACVRAAEEELAAAGGMGPAGRYDYLRYLIQLDFYERKRLRSKNPGSRELLEAAVSGGVTRAEIESILRHVPVPIGGDNA